MLIDTHSHLYLDQFAEDRDAVITRAKDAGVQHVLLPAIDSEHHNSLLQLASEDAAFFRPMMGVHPCSIKQETINEELEVAKSLLGDGTGFCAVGEIGIDLYWDNSTLSHQQEAFRIQIEWAKALDLPIVIHCRDAFNEIFEVIEELNDDQLRGVFHCFTGNREQADRIIGFGDFMIGLGGVLTFKNSGVDRAIAEVNMEHLVLETDAPYLAPAPYRGKRNESAYTALVAQKLAEIKGLSVEDVGRITTFNAQRIFKL